METGKAGKKSRKIVWTILGIVIIGLGTFVFFKYYFVFGSGVKTGTLNYVVHKGYIFKTYEGEMILSGVTSKRPGTIQSNQFLFSVDNKRLAEQLMRMGGKEVELQYKEYLGALPWRGYSKFVVDSILSARTAPGQTVIPENFSDQ